MARAKKAQDVSMGLRGWGSERVRSRAYKALDDFWPQHQVTAGDDASWDVAGDVSDALLANEDVARRDPATQQRLMRIAVQLAGADWDACERLDGAPPLSADDTVALALALDDYPFDHSGVTRERMNDAIADCAKSLGITSDGRRWVMIAGSVFCSSPVRRLSGEKIDLATRDYISAANRESFAAWYAEQTTGLPAEEWDNRPGSIGDALNLFEPPKLADKIPNAFLHSTPRKGASEQERLAMVMFDTDVLRAFQVEAFKMRMSGVSITGLNFEALMVAALEKCNYAAAQAKDKASAADVFFQHPSWDKPVSLQLKTTIQKHEDLKMNHYTHAGPEVKDLIEQKSLRSSTWGAASQKRRANMVDDQAMADLMYTAVGSHLEQYSGLVHMSDPTTDGDFSTCTFSAVNNTWLAQRLKTIAKDPVAAKDRWPELTFIRDEMSVAIELRDKARNFFRLRVGLFGSLAGHSAIEADGPNLVSEIAKVSIPMSQEHEIRGDQASVQERAQEMRDAMEIGT